MYFVRSPALGRPLPCTRLEVLTNTVVTQHPSRRIKCSFRTYAHASSSCVLRSPPALSAASLPVRPPLVLPFTPRSSSAASLPMSGLHRHAARPAAPLFTLPAGALLWLHAVVRHRLARHSIPLWKSTGIVLTCTTLASRLHRHESRWPRSSVPAWPVDRVPPRVQAHQD